MKLIANWRRCYRLYSIQLGLLIALFGFLQVSILPMWEAQLSDRAYAVLNSALALLLFLARLVKQGPDQDTPS
ncbi:MULTISPECIES: DUF7940 domain-containing protein [Pseudomonas]|uniref:Uncharacterized protein n=2 Tax=Pseudomonas TaxID=286 RepID=A0A1Q9R8U9_PSEPU|nr:MULTISPECIES: hypothetical protein [Pseudomonas]NNJ15469.1 hypothetical protein [Pseudomonas bharatica CSV86]OLS63761.1 hypothetical protein PSEMO_13280 [Pseudomonas putida]